MLFCVDRLQIINVFTSLSLDSYGVEEYEIDAPPSLFSPYFWAKWLLKFERVIEILKTPG